MEAGGSRVQDNRHLHPERMPGLGPGSPKEAKGSQPNKTSQNSGVCTESCTDVCWPRSSLTDTARGLALALSLMPEPEHDTQHVRGYSDSPGNTAVFARNETTHRFWYQWVSRSLFPWVPRTMYLTQILTFNFVIGFPVWVLFVYM